MMKTTILQSGDVAAFAKLAQFNTREDMDLAIRAWLLDNKHNLTITEEKVVHLIAQLSYKLKGVFFCKHQTLAKHLELSNKTIQRCLKKLKESGLLSVHETRTSVKQKTAKGKGNPKGRGHNVYVINSVDTTRLIEHVQSNVQSVMSSRPSSGNVDTASAQGSKKEADALFPYTEFSKRVIKTFVHKECPSSNQISNSDLVGHWIPKSFKEVASIVFETPKEIERAYKVIRNIVKKSGYHSDDDLLDFSNLTIRAYFRKIKEKAKNNEIIHEPFAYITGIIKEIIDDHYVSPLYKMDSFDNSKETVIPEVFTENGRRVLYNWLIERD